MLISNTNEIGGMSINKRKLVEKTKEILANLDIPPRIIDDEAGQFRFFSRGEFSIGLRDHTVDIFEDAIKVISDSDDYKDISIKRIEDEYIQSLINLLKLNSDYTVEIIKAEINRCLKELTESIEEYRVLIPIDFFKLVDIQELKIGKVRFIDYNSISENIKCSLCKIIDNNPTIPLEHKSLNKKHSEEMAIEPFMNKVCADITLEDFEQPRSLDLE
jgi:hypothetical protein